MARKLELGKRLAGLVVGVALWALHVLAAAQAIYPGKSWAQPAPEATGWAADRLKAADEVARSIGTSAYLVVHKGVVVHAFGPIAQPMNLASVRKSVLSVLYGIGVDRQQIDLAKTLAELDINDKDGLSEAERSASVRELLQSRSGVYHPAAYETAEMKAARPTRGGHPPGTFWYYNNWDFNALGTIFQRTTGRTVFEALEVELAVPLQFEDFRPDRDTESVLERSSIHSAYVMRISARDLARIGLLMARDGRWQDKQIVSAQWIRESTASYSNAEPGVGYGYLWWVGLDHWHFQQRFSGAVFSARGNYGQFLLVDPARDLIVVHRVDMDRWFGRQVSRGAFNSLLAKVLAAAP